MQRQELPKSEQCLNCGYTVTEHKYCPECGQENVNYRVKLRILLQYYAFKYLRFDVKWIITVKTLLIRPWYLTQTYLQGKRKQYTHPFRLYLVISVLFFLGMRMQVMWNKSNTAKSTFNINIDFSNVKTREKINSQKFLLQFINQLPNAMLVSVPLVALVLTMLYYRKTEYLFLDHFTLMLHYYAFVYLISLPFLFIPHIHIVFAVIPTLISSIYLWLFIKKFYRENTLLTTFKCLIFALLSTAIIAILSVLLVIIVVLKEVLLKQNIE